MPATSITLFRMGNAGGPRMDHVRDKDIMIVASGDGDRVIAGTGGVSTSETRGVIEGRWWRLNAGFDYGDLLLVWNDHGRHWSWEPIRDMLLADFRMALRATHAGFFRV